MSETLVWWLMVQVVGLAALPLCLTLFRRLPDRGYTLSKPFALLLVGYLFWILNVTRVLPNTTVGIVFVLVLFFLASAFLLWRRRGELLAFVRERWWLIAATEALFFVAFITAAYLRSYVPDLGGTEKPMDFMFLNAVTRGESFPPTDPWLAGENVSYYYFGYLLVSIMTRLSGLETSIGYNLGLAMIVALAVTGVFGLVYNLAAPREEREAEAGPDGRPVGTGPGTPRPGRQAGAAGFPSRPLLRPMAFGLAAGLLLAIMGNLEGLLELLAAHDFGSNGFWDWVGVKDLIGYDSSKWYPDQHWFWWRATRILDGGVGIHEIPFFSFLLGDLHPHVMSIPFVLLAVGAALTLFRSEGPLDLVVWLERPLWLVAFGLILGGLAFLNTWDMPTMTFVVALIALLRNRLLTDRWSWGLALDAAGFVAPLFFVAFLAYTPFFFGGFTSQASGFTAVAGAGSGLFHTFLLWGPFAALVLPYAAWRLSRSDRPVTLAAVLWSLAPAAALVALWLVWDLLAKGFDWLPAGIRLNEAGFERPGLDADLWSRIPRRGWNWLTVLALGGSLGLLVLALIREVDAAKRATDERLGHVFALALSATAALLILGAEFFYIEDTFSSRMNTIFKLYYQSWLLLSIAGGFALYELTRGWRLPAIGALEAPTFATSLGNWSLGELVVVVATFGGAIVGVVLTPDLLTRIVGAASGAGISFVVSAAAVLVWRATAPPLEAATAAGALTWRALWAGGATVVLLAAFVYPLLATFNRTNAFDLPRTLDGLGNLPGDEYAAIEWLADLDGQPVIAEALGADYTEGGRISAATGLPTLLQWPGHQLQWRGDSAPQTGRPEALERLYTSSDPDEVISVIQEYDIAFVYLGHRERATYPGLTLPEMSNLFAEPCVDQQADQRLCSFQQGEVIIYRVRPGILTEVTRE